MGDTKKSCNPPADPKLDVIFNSIKLDKYEFLFASIKYGEGEPRLNYFRLESKYWDGIFKSNPLFTKDECHKMFIDQIERKYFPVLQQQLEDDYKDVVSRLIKKRGTHDRT